MKSKITTYIPEIIDKVVQAKTDKDKVAVLLANDSKALRAVLHFALHPKYTKAFDRIPEYEPDDAPFGFTMSSLYLVYTKLPYLFKENQMYIPAERIRNKQLMNMMQSVHFTESALLEKVLTRTFTDISLEVAQKAFPQQFKDIK